MNEQGCKILYSNKSRKVVRACLLSEIFLIHSIKRQMQATEVKYVYNLKFNSGFSKEQMRH